MNLLRAGTMGLIGAKLGKRVTGARRREWAQATQNSMQSMNQPYHRFARISS